MSCSKPMALMDLYNWKVVGLVLATSSAAVLLVKLIADHFNSNDSNEKTIDLRIVIPGDKVGAIIGSKGRTLRRIEFETKTILELETNRIRKESERVGEWERGDSGERKTTQNGVLRIRGQRLDVHKAKLAVEAILIEAAVGRLREIITIPRETIGWIIGKGGESVQRMKEQCGVSINVGRDGTGETEQVSIFGPPDGIALAKKLVDCKVAKFYSRHDEKRSRRRSVEEEDDTYVDEMLKIRHELGKDEDDW